MAFFIPLDKNVCSQTFSGMKHDRKDLKMVNFNSFGARTTLQSLVKICCFDPCYLANFWRI